MGFRQIFISLLCNVIRLCCITSRTLKGFCDESKAFVECVTMCGGKGYQKFRDVINGCNLITFSGFLKKDSISDPRQDCRTIRDEDTNRFVCCNC